MQIHWKYNSRGMTVQDATQDSIHIAPRVVFVFCVLFARDSLWLCALNSATSFVAGFAVFSILGFMAHQQDVTMDNVVESGTQSVWFSFMACIASPC